MVVFRGDTEHAVGKYLMSYEGHVIAVRRHPAVLLNALLLAVGLLILCGLVQGFTGFAWVWVLWALSLVYLLGKVYEWSDEFFVVTEHRIMLIHGIITRTVAMMPLAQVTDIALNRSARGRLLGYGEFIMESAGQKQALRNVDYIPYPEQLYLEVSSVVFGVTDATD
ncbi:PH domain-containing protein [Actinomadura sp. PM05-2]|uniref:PH domain-containing protein n=2 Tax=Actinomadura parmotrematis TaxID=2864039 RepID=A0ABS7G0Q0_9ACTN|nr:PH domain-containing protein [Actinomadura parmotrematis]